MTGRITRLEIEGYKSLKHVVWEPGKLNILIGPNGSGKSNLLRLLEMLAASAKGEQKDFINADGGMEAILWDRRAGEMSVELRSAFATDETGQTERSSTDFTYSIALELDKRWNRQVITRESLQAIDLNKESTTYIDRDRDSMTILLADGAPRVQGHRDDLDTALHMSFYHREDERAHPSFRLFREFLSGPKCYIHPDVGLGSIIRDPTTVRYEADLLPDGRNLVNFLYTMRNESPLFRENLDQLLKAVFPDMEEIQISPAADQYIQMRVRWKSLQSPQPAALLSDGILKFLFLASIFSNPDLPSLIAIDEPDVGFHPSVLHIIAEIASEASERTQVVLATHSPEFLNAIQDVNPDVSVSVMEWSEGETLLKNLSGEKLQYWLKEYRLGEMFRSGGLEAL